MVNITRETYENSGIEVIADEHDELWLNERHVQEQLRLKNLPALTNKHPKEHKKQRSELNKSTNQPNRRFIHVDLALKVIMNSRTDESCKFKRNLGFTLHDVINTKEQTVINSIKDAFEGENMQTQYTVLGYRIDLYFHKYKLAIEVDELGHADRNINDEIERQRALERELNCVLIRINPDAADYNIYREINKIHRHSNQSNKVTLKEEQAKIKKQEDKNKELEDEINRLNLQLANLSVKNNDDNDKK